jgi:hypothetical protein
MAGESVVAVLIAKAGASLSRGDSVSGEGRTGEAKRRGTGYIVLASPCRLEKGPRSEDDEWAIFCKPIAFNVLTLRRLASQTCPEGADPIDFADMFC